ncbi:S41 family peptidase [uncultured Dokdonia sp.]|uniref:S41 family peptidase n=1 Tax=uncultured Dokdonia sp. TaxID=575653 RepID=UPI002606C6C8|nr:S41 family peptidase [uncultured Dokdonia sp.]
MKTKLTTVLTALFLMIFAFGNLSAASAQNIARQAGAQTSPLCDCKTDLDFLATKMQDMVSYKKQIKGDMVSEFQKTYHSLSEEMKSSISKVDCLFKLNTLLSVVKDKHASIASTSDIITKEQYQDSIYRMNFKQTAIFKEHPTAAINLTELRTRLSQMPFENIEGVYTDRYVGEIGVYETTTKGNYIAVVLEATSDFWGTGQIAYQINKIEGDEYQVLRYHPYSRKLWFQKSMLAYNGKLWGLQKELQGPNHAEAPSENGDWEFKQLTNDTQYLYFGSFSNRKSNVEAFKKFYAEHKDNINAPNVIVDLRNNGGGNSKYSDPFVKILKKSGAKVYVITNYFTGSNGEQFTLKLKKLNNTVHLGQRTNGIIAYGMNYGTSYDSPTGNFSFTPTDMNFHKFIQYEMVGIQPEIKLDFSRDWIAQTQEIIEGQLP